MNTYLSFLQAEKILQQRLGATREEIAAWVNLSPELGGDSINRLLHYSPRKAKDTPPSVSLPALEFWPALPLPGIAAYTNVNELDPPPRFHFAYSTGDDYLAPLMSCWFKKLDIFSFRPKDRFITGKQLVERWTPSVGDLVDAFIRARIRESRLLDHHPIRGLTQWSEPDAPHAPPKESALFVLSQVQAIEAEDGIGLPTALETTTQPEGAQAKSEGTWEEQARMIADEFFDRDTTNQSRDSLRGYATRVMDEMQKREIHGPRGRITNPSTIQREALQGSKWWKNKRK